MARDGVAIVYCENGFGSTLGKTAHGLVRGTERYEVVAIIDSTLAGRDAGEALDGRPRRMPIVGDLAAALQHARSLGKTASHFVIGLAPDGGTLDAAGLAAVSEAIRSGLSVDSGLHHFLSEDPELVALARSHGVTLRDVRKPPPRAALHFYSGKIHEVKALRIAVLGTDSALGKRTTARLAESALKASGVSAVMIGTGQTSWLQGAKYSLILDSLVNDFVAGEIEHQVWLADREQSPQVILIEGQGSLLNPAYPGGFEILAASRPHGILLQHAPARTHYDGFDTPMDPLDKQIQALELIGRCPVIGITLNQAGVAPERIPGIMQEIADQTGLPCTDPVRDGGEPTSRIIMEFARRVGR